MKKFFFMAAMASIALASCVNDVSDVAAEQQKEITFAAPVVSSNSRAIIGGSSLNSGDTDFSVYGWYCEASNYDPNHASTKIYMDNVIVKEDDDFEDTEDIGTGTWKPEKAYYWPKNGKLTFDAYYPVYDASSTSAFTTAFGATSSVTSDKTSGLSFTNVVIPTGTPNTVDLLYSTRIKDQINSTGSISAYDGVDINFNHALSAIYFNLKAADDETVAGIRIKSITVKAYSKGSFTKSASTPEWSVVKSDNTLAVDYNFLTSTEWTDAKVLTTTGAVHETYGILLPQEFTDNYASITIEYYIARGEDYTWVESQTFYLKDTWHTDGSNTITEWEMGKKYTYNFTFDFNIMNFAPSVSVWTEVGVVNQEINGGVVTP